MLNVWNTCWDLSKAIKPRDTSTTIHLLAMFPANLFEENLSYSGISHSTTIQCITVYSFQSLVLRILGCEYSNKLELLNFVFDHFICKKFDDNTVNGNGFGYMIVECPGKLFFIDCLFCCFLEQNHAIVKELLTFFINKTDFDVQKIILENILKFYSYSKRCYSTPQNFRLWSDDILLDVLNMLNILDLHLDENLTKQIISIFSLPIIKYFYELGFDCINVKNVYLDYNYKIKFEVVKFLFEIGMDFTTDDNFLLIDWSSDEQVIYFIEVICGSDKNLIKKLKSKFKSVTISGNLYEKLHKEYFNSKS
jgi:hypothetical protein